MQKKLIFDSDLLDITLGRLCGKYDRRERLCRIRGQQGLGGETGVGSTASALAQAPGAGFVQALADIFFAGANVSQLEARMLRQAREKSLADDAGGAQHGDGNPGGTHARTRNS